MSDLYPMSDLNKVPDLNKKQIEFWRRNLLEGGLDYPLSGKLTEFIEQYCQNHQVGDRIIELACGLNPSSDGIQSGNLNKRILIDIVDLSQIYQEKRPGINFIQADLNQSHILIQEKPYRQLLDQMGGSFDTLVIGSGINYFNWKKNIPLFLKDLTVGGLVFLYTGIFNMDYTGSDLHETVDKVNRPKNVEEVRDFFLNHGFIFEELQTPYYAPTKQHQILVCARKID